MAKPDPVAQVEALPNPQHATAASAPRSRRRFIAAAGGAGVLLSVHAKTALGGGYCMSPSAMVSGNASAAPNTQTCFGGRSPGFWKQPQHFADWGLAGATAPQFTVDSSQITNGPCRNGQGKLKSADIVTAGTLVEDVLPGAPVGLGTGIWEVLAFPNNFNGGGSPNGQHMRHMIAAWLNAGRYTDYPIRRDQLRDMWNAMLRGMTYCPPSISCAPGMGMTADQIKAYIEGMYDVGEGPEKVLCKPSSSSP